MPIKEGKITKVWTQAIAKPDQFGNTHRVSFIIDDDFYQIGNSKSVRSPVYVNKENTDVSEGDLVSFRFENKEVGGKIYKNIDKKSFNIEEKGPREQATTSTGANKSNKKEEVHGGEVGQAMNFAKDLGLLKWKDFSDKDKVRAFIKQFRQARVLWTEMYLEDKRAGESEKKVTTPTPTPGNDSSTQVLPKTEDLNNTDSDDDVPF